MADPVFFTSYARGDDTPSSKLGNSIDYLRERVGQSLNGMSKDDVGFLDLDQLYDGDDWKQKILHAVMRCQVFVCFCSDAYFNREICGREFEAFRARIPKNGANGDRYVFPILWERCTLPLALSGIQTGSGPDSDDYRNNGLRALRIFRYKRYSRTVDAIAKSIVDAVKSNAKRAAELPHGDHTIDFDQLASAFDHAHASAPRIGVLDPLGFRWTMNDYSTAREIIDGAVRSRGGGWRAQKISVTVAQELNALGGPDSPFVLIVPPNPDAMLRIRLAVIDAWAVDPAKFVAILVGVTRPPGSAAPGAGSEDALLGSLCPKSFPIHSKRFATFDTSSSASLSEALRVALERLSQDVLSATATARADDATIVKDALVHGVTVAARPILPTPGAST